MRCSILGDIGCPPHEQQHCACAKIELEEEEEEEEADDGGW